MANNTTLTGKKVLWVEDDQFLGELISKKLISSGCATTYASSGEKALEELAKNTPDVVLLDIMLPGGIDGFAILEKMRANPAQKDVPVILFSNLNSKEDVQKGMKLGASRFLIKATLVPDEIVTEIESVLNEKSKS
ncbi:MAG: response regulator [Parcubacteria group bacterium]|nr:response regulator [Parcubacteria group bacterium]